MSEGTFGCRWFISGLLSGVFFNCSSIWRLIYIHESTTFLYRQREIPDTFYNRAQSLSFLHSAVDETLRYGTTIFNKKRDLAGWQLADRSPSRADEPLMACEGDSLTDNLPINALPASSSVILTASWLWQDQWNTIHVYCRKVASNKSRKWHFNAFFAHLKRSTEAEHWLGGAWELYWWIVNNTSFA